MKSLVYILLLLVCMNRCIAQTTIKLSNGGKVVYNKDHATAYDKAGKKVSSGRVEKMKPTGEWEFYSPVNYALISKVEVRNGLLEGPAVYFNPFTGNKIGEGQHLNNKRTGRWKFYAVNTGKMHGIENYENGLMEGKAVYYDTVDNQDPALDIKIADGQYEKNLRVGEWIFYNPSGFINGRETYKDSILNGPASYYYEGTGKKISEGTYLNGMAEGTWITYDSVTGYKMSEVFFRQGEDTGSTRWFYNDERGVLKEVLRYRGEPLHGAQEDYDSVTTLIKDKVYWDNGEIISLVNYDDQGRRKDSFVGEKNFTRSYLVHFNPECDKISLESFYNGTPGGKSKSRSKVYYQCSDRLYYEYEMKNDVLHGKSIYYDSLTGNVWAEGNFKNASKDGKWKYYHPVAGVLKSEENYINGVLEGEVTNYDSNGHIIAKYQFKNGLKSGEWIYYFEQTDKPWMIISYKEDSLNGDFKTYYYSGKIKRREEYRMGRRSSAKCYNEDGTEIPFYPLVVQAEFNGDVMTYIGNNLRYPNEAIQKKIEGKVLVRFSINESGSVSNAEIIKGIGYGCDEEALRLVRQMPPWQPMLIEDRPVETMKTLPIVFWLKEDK